MVALLNDAPVGAIVEPADIHLDGPPAPATPPSRDDADALRSLEVTGLTFRHPRTGRGIEHVDLAIERGSFTVLTGRVGAGKTTLLRALLGLVPHDGGAIRWNGHAVEDPATFFVPPRCAYTPQAPRLLSETLGDNIRLGVDAGPADTERAVRLAVLEDDVAQMEHGLTTMLGPRGVRLSGGQVQRAAAARMFVRVPELLVFDDISSALDVETERLLWDRLFAEGDVTCLAVSNRRAAFARADRIVVLQGGRVAASGDLATLLRDCEEMRVLWEQAGDDLAASAPASSTTRGA
jgi:ATP-binding cassette subfamily B protein